MTKKLIAPLLILLVAGFFAARWLVQRLSPQPFGAAAEAVPQQELQPVFESLLLVPLILERLSEQEYESLQLRHVIGQVVRNFRRHGRG